MNVRAAPGVLWPIGLGAALVLAAPLIYLVVRAAQGGGAAVEALASTELLWLMWRSASLAIAVGATASVLALLFAVLVEARDLPLRRALSVLVLLPLAVPCYVGASAYVAGLSPAGPFGELLGRIGIGPLELEGFGWAATILSIYTAPLAYLPIRAAIARADGALLEAARTLGLGPWSALAHALRASIPRAVVSGFVLVTLYTLGEFGAVALLRYDAFPRVIYLQFLSAFDRSAAAVSSLALVAIIAVVLVAANLLDRRHTRGSDRPRPLRFELGARARWIALAPMLAYLFAAVVVPVGSIVSWMVRGQAAAVAGVGGALVASAHAALLAIVPAVVAGTAVAILAERTRRGRRLARFVDLGFALPGLVVALGLTFMVLRTAPALYQTWAPYVVAMVILFCPLASAAVRGALAAAPPVLEEAARTLGASPAAALRRVTLPVVAPGIAAGAALVTIATMKELSATLLLVPPGTSTLATRLWGATEEARYAEAAAPALLLIALAGAAGLVARRRRGAA